MACNFEVLKIQDMARGQTPSLFEKGTSTPSPTGHNYPQIYYYYFTIEFDVYRYSLR